jgi:hypothetical protein
MPEMIHSSLRSEYVSELEARQPDWTEARNQWGAGFISTVVTSSAV